MTPEEFHQQQIRDHNRFSEDERINRPTKAHGWWRVEVKLYDGTLVVIEPDMIAGKEGLSPKDEETIRQAAGRLLGFVGVSS